MLAHTERFRWGYTPEGGKKADLLFLQHMLSVCADDGMVATVMPHGVLFRGGAEGEIGRKLIEQDRLEAVIGLGPNLFYGTGIPAARAWYGSVGTPWLRRRIRPWTARLGFDAVAMDVRDLGYRWGSCRMYPGPERINIHWATLQLPPTLIDYVLVHELAHLQQPNHTPAFWGRWVVSSHTLQS